MNLATWKVVSGGQTGADRAGLDWANRLILGIPGKAYKVFFNVRQCGEATVWQYTRFDEDKQYWEGKLGHVNIDEKPVKKHGRAGTSLQFQLTTDVHIDKWEELFLSR
jgi:hypothetical protein